ncbi:hypothetical protein HHK36_033226 [Tetracentron sinense]|uniref:FAS1 domain-containing protein n=1 Tax=Tetracentron sinense TaxID=13715 RepID=A0A834Y460_TETSI|nr:hypothetical protein HHK36_033226 [Tetracentron sinense]
MDPKPFSLLFLFFFLLFSSATSFNITKLLGQYPEFKTFNDYLTQTQLASEINRRQTITVLAVDNTALSSLSGVSTDVIKKVLSLHVVLDYFDADKLQKLSNKTALLTTLFQASGGATAQEGFLNVTDLSTGGVSFGSAVKGSTLGAKLVKSVAAQPYNISVLQISAAIIPSGIENSNSPPPSTAPVATPSPTKAPSSSKVPPAKAPSAASPKSADAPAPSDDSSAAPSDADAPSNADADAPSDAPAGVDSPLSSPPSPGDADGPTGDLPAGGPSAPGPSRPHSSGTRVAFGTCLTVIIGVVSLGAL